VNRALQFMVFVALICPGAASKSASSEPATTEGQVLLGNKYLDEKNYSSAMVWFRRAAEHGNAVAQNNIGWLHENGFGVQQDYAEAMTWFSKAASQHYAEAQNNVGWMYREGLGVKQDYVQARN
jgi:uncharacterized protein